MPRPQNLTLFSKVSPTFTPNISQPSPDTLIDNAPYNRFYHVAVTKPCNTPIYDLAAIAEPTGAICLAVTKTLRLALIRNFRAVPTTAPGDSTAFEKPELTRHGFYSLELPRGFPEQGETRGEAAARETREELGVGVGEVLFLGWCNCNTAMFMTDVPVFVVCVRKEVCVDDEKDEGEAIANVEWVELEEAVRRVAHGEIRCGMTLSGLMYAVAMREKIAAFVTGEIDGVGEVKG